MRSFPVTTRLAGLVIALTLLHSGAPALAAEEAAKAAADAKGTAAEAKDTAADAKGAAAEAKDTAAEAQKTAAAATVSLNELMEMLKKQQAQIEAQQQQLDAQNELIKTLQKQGGQVAEQETQIEAQEAQIEVQRKSMQAMQVQVDQIGEFDPNKLSEEQIKNRQKMQTIEESLKASEESSSTVFDAESFPGSMAIPGTSAAIRIGGFVKMNIVESLDPIVSKDRFIVGTIPVPQESGQPEASITVDQSRLNFDLREKTSFGPLRAFIEGDFAGDNTSFRLRHAFGQWKSMLAGQTWTTFMDNEASPEELDFEGINGRINVRQPEIRYFPEIGRNMNLLVALENPDAQITNGTGLSQWPDFVASIRRTYFDIFHVKTALLVRNIEANWIPDPFNPPTNPVEDSVIGWGLTVSGTTPLPWWDKRDNFLYQVNYGDGYGRYVNDLGTIGAETGDGFDAIFDPTGNLEGFKVLAYYVAMQKWVGDAIRVNFNYSFVDVKNYDFQLLEAYNQTRRASANAIWSPTARVDIGGEMLWGQRKNRDGQSADAVQFQFSAKYRY